MRKKIIKDETAEEAEKQAIEKGTINVLTQIYAMIDDAVTCQGSGYVKFTFDETSPSIIDKVKDKLTEHGYTIIELTKEIETAAKNKRNQTTFLISWPN